MPSCWAKQRHMLYIALAVSCGSLFVVLFHVNIKDSLTKLSYGTTQDDLLDYSNKTTNSTNSPSLASRSCRLILEELSLAVLNQLLIFDQELISSPSAVYRLGFFVDDSDAVLKHLGPGAIIVHGVDPRALPNQTRPLPVTHAVLTAPDCVLHLHLILPRGKRLNGSTVFWWSDSLALTLEGVPLSTPARAFPAEVTFVELSSPPPHLPSGLRVAEDWAYFNWTRSFPFRECSWPVVERHNAWSPQNMTTQGLKDEMAEGTALAMTIFDRLRLPVFACCGSLIGYLRECDVLAHAETPNSADVDFCLNAEHYYEGIELEFAKTKLPRLSQRLGSTKYSNLEFRFMHSMNATYLNRERIAIDLFLDFPRSDGKPGVQYALTYINDRRWYLTYNERLEDNQLCSAQMRGSLIRVPCAPETRVASEGGVLWDRSVAHWSYNDANNFHFGGTWNESETPDIVLHY